MVKQQDLQAVVEAVNQVLKQFESRIAALEESAKQASSSNNTKKVKEKT